MEKIKAYIDRCIDSEKGKDILIVFIVILVGAGSFELGRLSKSSGGSSSGIKIEYPTGNPGNLSASVVQTGNNLKLPTPENTVGKAFFASSRGTKYYSLGCSAGKSIKQENRIYFATREEAMSAGYELSSSCK